ncbi:MAG: MurT ligase domain-containing protein [Oscillospiraceae bacterium]
MKKAIVILLCKIAAFVGKLIGKGSSLPGKLALKMYPDILEKIELCDKIVAVTGSNGKTSTVELIASVLKKNNINVIYNKEGSNQIEGVTTMVLCNSTLRGKLKGDVLLIESDERYARHTFKHFTPTHFVITNLYRDQLTRNGHPEWLYDIISESIRPETTLILNADDPIISTFANRGNPTIYFGIGRLETDSETCKSLYNDGVYCPVCKSKMEYSYYHYNHIGCYKCQNCGHQRQNPNYEVTSLDLKNGKMIINEKYEISLFLKSIYNVYNTLAAFAVCDILALDKEKIAADISDHILKNGRIVAFKTGERKGILLTSKHENSISYNQSIELAVNNPTPCTVVIIVDAISRKYFTSETSWLWDIDFENLISDNVTKIILTGNYCYDLATRFEYTEINEEKIAVIKDIGEAIEKLASFGTGDIFAITCFSDKDKFLSKVEMTELKGDNNGN